jgi:RimJ/RimL family protein N-acetyltransferase
VERRPQPEIRAASVRDLDALVGLALACGRAQRGWSRSAWFPPALPAERRLWWELLHDVRAWSAVAAAGPTVVGCVCARPARGQDAYVTGPLVDPEWWGMGIGRSLHEELLRGLEGLGCRRAELLVEAGNGRARRFLELNGWLRVDESPPRSPMVLLPYARSVSGPSRFARAA